MARMAGRLTERARLYLLILALVLAQGGGLVVAFAVIVDNARDSQRDFCAMLSVFVDPRAPAPANLTDDQRARYEALRAYQVKRC